MLCVLCHRRDPCRLFIHDKFLWGTLGLHLLVWSSALGRSWPFQPMRDRGMQWPWPCNLMCEAPINVGVPKSNIAIIWMPIFRVRMCFKFGSTSGHQKERFLEMVCLCAQYTVTIPCSVANMIWRGGGDYMTTYWARGSSFEQWINYSYEPWKCTYPCGLKIGQTLNRLTFLWKPC